MVYVVRDEPRLRELCSLSCSRAGSDGAVQGLFVVKHWRQDLALRRPRCSRIAAGTPGAPSA
jgi:hypothetical protein